MAIASPPDGQGQIIGFKSTFKEVLRKMAARWKKWRTRNSPQSERFGMEPVNGAI